MLGVPLRAASRLNGGAEGGHGRVTPVSPGGPKGEVGAGHPIAGRGADGREPTPGVFGGLVRVERALASVERLDAGTGPTPSILGSEDLFGVFCHGKGDEEGVDKEEGG